MKVNVITITMNATNQSNYSNFSQHLCGSTRQDVPTPSAFFEVSIKFHKSLKMST